MTNIPRESRVNAGGIELAVFEWPGEGPPILFAHANSFHARCWDQVIAHLPGRHCIALDQRGHGRSSKPGTPYQWRSFGADLAALAQALDLRGAVGVGHSLGGYATALAAATVPHAFSALLLIDPVILPQRLYIGRLPGQHWAARRRREWDSPEAMFERFRDRSPFREWVPAVLRDYCTYGVLPDPQSGRYLLACPPEVEADIYQGTTEQDIHRELGTIDVPVTVVRAARYQTNPAEDLSASPTDPQLANAFRHGRDICLDDATHFIPMEMPEQVAAYVRELLP